MFLPVMHFRCLTRIRIPLIRIVRPPLTIHRCRIGIYMCRTPKFSLFQIHVIGQRVCLQSHIRVRQHHITVYVKHFRVRIVMSYLTHQSLVSVHRNSPRVVGRYRREAVIPQMVRLQHRLPVYQSHRVVPYIQHPALSVIIQLVAVYCGRIADFYLYMAKCGEIIPHRVQQRRIRM